jgi:hypothetical protein
MKEDEHRGRIYWWGKSASEKIFAGGLMFPLLRYSMISQTRSMQSGPVYKYFLNFLISVPKTEGVKGYWKGFSSFFFFTITHSAVNTVLQPYVSHLFFDKQENISLTKYAIYDVTNLSLCYLISSLVAYPFERAMTLASCEITKKDEKKLYGSSVSVLKQVYARDGLKGLYQGFSLSCSRFVLFLALADYLKFIQRMDLYVDRLELKFACSIACTAIPKAIFYPLYVMATRRQLSDRVNYKEPMNFFSQAKEIYGSLGIRGFFRGMVPCGVYGFLTVLISVVFKN